MPDINWGGDATSAPFKSRLDETDGNLVIAEDTNGETRLLEWDGTAWQVRGPVELNGEDVSGVGTLSATDLNADSVNTESASIDRIFKTARNDVELGSLLPANGGDLILLGSETFNENYTIDNPITLRGTSSTQTEGTEFDEKLILNARCTIENMVFRNGVDINTDYTVLNNIGLYTNSNITVDADDVIIDGLSGTRGVVFEAETVDGTVGARNGQPVITDDGDNNIMPLN